MNEKASNVNIGYQLGIWIVFAVLLYLKLSGQTDISWWWVFAPLWLPIVILLGLVAVISLVVMVYKLLTK